MHRRISGGHKVLYHISYLKTTFFTYFFENVDVTFFFCQRKKDRRFFSAVSFVFKLLNFGHGQEIKSGKSKTRPQFTVTLTPL